MFLKCVCGPFYHENAINVYLDRRGGGGGSSTKETSLKTFHVVSVLASTGVPNVPLVVEDIEHLCKMHFLVGIVDMTLFTQ